MRQNHSIITQDHTTREDFMAPKTGTATLTPEIDATIANEDVNPSGLTNSEAMFVAGLGYLIQMDTTQGGRSMDEAIRKATAWLTHAKNGGPF
jgi:hypothetical protein